MPPVTPSDGPVAVTGCAGYIGSHVCLNLVQNGYTVRACVRDAHNFPKTSHLLQMNNQGYSGSLRLYEADMLIEGSYDSIFKGCSCVFHVAAEMGNLPDSTPLKVYEGGRKAIIPVLDSVKKSGSVKRFIFTSSFAAVGHGGVKEGHVYTEDSWAYFKSGTDKTKARHWNMKVAAKNRDVAYSMTKVETELYCYEEAAKHGGFDAFGVMPCHVVGPVLCAKHNISYAWQSMIGDLMQGFSHRSMFWNTVDVRDVAQAQRLIAECKTNKNGERYNLVAHDEDGLIPTSKVQKILREAFPGYGIGGGLFRNTDKATGKKVWSEEGKVNRGPVSYMQRCVVSIIPTY